MHGLWYNTDSNYNRLSNNAIAINDDEDINYAFRDNVVSKIGKMIPAYC